MFVNEEFKLISLGHHYVRSFTIVHYLERVSKVNYRYDKTFRILYKYFNKIKTKYFSLFVRKLNICDHSTITFYCDKIFLEKKIINFFKFKKLINFSLDIKNTSKLILTDLKKKDQN